MAKQYVYKLNKGADYFINQKWLTDTFMIINRYLLTTNSELLNDRLKTNESFKYTNLRGINKDIQVPDLDEIVHQSESLIKDDNKLIKTDLKLDICKTTCNIFFNTVQKHFIFVDITYISLFENIAKQLKADIAFYNSTPLGTIAVLFDQEQVGIIMPVQKRQGILPSDLVVISNGDIKDSDLKNKIIIL